MTQTRMNVLIAIVVGVLGLAALSLVVAYYAAFSLPGTSTTRIDHEARARELTWAQGAKLQLIQNGTVTKIDCQSHEVQVDLAAWSAVPVDTKKVAVETLSRICTAETRLGHVALIDNRSGRTLAEFSSWSGVTLR